MSVLEYMFSNKRLPPKDRQLRVKGEGKKKWQCVEFCYWEGGGWEGKNEILILGKKPDKIKSKENLYRSIVCNGLLDI